MLRNLGVVVLLLVIWSCSDKNEPTTASVNNSKNSNTKEEVQTPIAEKTTSFDDFLSCFSDTLNGTVLTKEFIDSKIGIALSDKLINDWIIYDTYAVVGHSIREENDSWIPIGLFASDSVATVCVVQKSSSTSAYLFQYNTKSDYFMYMHQIGYIDEFVYQDKNAEAGEEYDFDITECESISLEVKNNQLYTSCERYTATVGKDWRVDQNLYVNDTVKLPIIESSYSLY